MVLGCLYVSNLCAEGVEYCFDGNEFLILFTQPQTGTFDTH